MELQLNLLGQLHFYPEDQARQRTLSCPEGASILEIVGMLGVPEGDIYSAIVGDRPRNLSYQPHDGEQITIIPVSVSG